jgi:VanZ family protein
VTATARIWQWGPVVLWAGVIFALSSIPSLGTGLGIWDEVLRSLAHALEFAVLGALLARALSSPWAALALASLYAVTDEIHQSFVTGRAGTVSDWAIDTAGAALGVAAYLAWRRRR